MALLALVTLMPGRLGSQAKLVAVRRELGSDRALVAIREMAAQQLRVLGPPVGFGPRPGAPRPKRRRLQQQTGPDPPLPLR